MNPTSQREGASRVYRQRARAEAAGRTRESILAATVELVLRKGTASMSLADVALAADVSVQTVLRHFGSRDALLDAALEYGSDLVAQERRAPVGDIPRAVSVLFDHYEKRGDAVIRLLGQESFDNRIAMVTDAGRSAHRTWVAETIVPGVDADEEVVDQLVVVTDVYAWKLLRRDRGLDRTAAQERVLRLVMAVLGASALAAPTARSAQSAPSAREGNRP